MRMYMYVQHKLKIFMMLFLYRVHPVLLVKKVTLAGLVPQGPTETPDQVDELESLEHL